ncbi:hypothetical protein NQ317_005144 [Molorchus minor]|uniref:Uncharacterized protein n=1 Tax=Molorchus minor TaxID=1323400 RepID=A0ABQ9IU95_9CUCU|nr:hypothetical protein NQ317_005144 [Molorchus minor]
MDWVPVLITNLRTNCFFYYFTEVFHLFYTPKEGNINYLSDAATFNVFDACVASGGRDSSKDQLDPFGKLLFFTRLEYYSSRH